MARRKSLRKDHFEKEPVLIEVTKAPNRYGEETILVIYKTFYFSAYLISVSEQNRVKIARESV